MKKLSTTVLALLCFGCTGVVASPKADGFAFCSEQEFEKPIRSIAVKDSPTYFDACEECKSRGGVKKIKKGAVVNVYAAGRNCNGGKTIFLNIDDIGFTGVKASDFKKID
ncbi:MAG TPA: hypothetical protein PKW30_06110 [Campylobacterales bacterium]|nr:hypothetical protein [Campylobacterales bacterium]